MDKNITDKIHPFNFFTSLRSYWLLVFVVAIQACSSDEQPAPMPAENEFFVSSTELLTVSQSDIQQLAVLAGFGQFTGLIENGFTIHRVTYKTTFRDEPITASGLVVIPNGLDGPLPLLSAHHGTIFSNDEAPSEFSLTNGISGFELLSAAGFVSIIPDFIGYGESKDILHPYYNFKYTSSAILDMISAAKEFLDDQNIRYSEKLFLIGYSEGGYATLAVQRAIEEDPDGTLSVTATAAGAGGYDIPGVMDEILKNDTYDSPGYLAFITYAAIETNQWSEPLTGFFQEPFASRIPDLFDGSLTQSGVNNALSDDLGDLFNPTLLANLRNGVPTQLSDEFRLNSVDDWLPTSPVKLYHSPGDNIIPIVNSIDTANKLIANGGDQVEFVEIGGNSHGSALIPMLEKAIPWFISLR
ncbi:lipase family protein [Fulvivirgaceae bacterium BMA12]|uniref:Lipase family protein n=1 Tax=Agaribacillus aureus TaxID=3051825 RepID=A0ABT8L918_9BACT|nr:lipase family protein [Fulvivirgaceae bacterium BMA12]